MCLSQICQFLSFDDHIVILPRTNVASVGSVFNDTRKVKVLSLPEAIKEKSTFRAKALRLLTPGEGPSLETSTFPLSFQIVREPLPFAYRNTVILGLNRKKYVPYCIVYT